jgi:hypothetical protein
LAEHGQEPIVELANVLVERFVRTSAEVWGDSLLPSLELPLVEEAQPGRQEREDSRGFMDGGRECGRRPRLVVVSRKRAILSW